MSKIKVIKKVPGLKPVSTHISNTLENLQKHVGGYIETVTIATDAMIICNEEGRILGLPHCCNIAGVDFYGPVILVGYDGDELTDWPVSWESTKQMFLDLWEIE